MITLYGEGHCLTDCLHFFNDIQAIETNEKYAAN